MDESMEELLEDSWSGRQTESQTKRQNDIVVIMIKCTTCLVFIYYIVAMALPLRVASSSLFILES